MPRIVNSLTKIDADDTYEQYYTGTIPVEDATSYILTFDWESAGTGGTIEIQDSRGIPYYQEGTKISVTSSSDAQFEIISKGDHFKYVAAGFAGSPVVAVDLSKKRVNI